MARTWTAVLARMDTPTGDGRVLAGSGAATRDLPLPLLFQGQTDDGHGGSIVVGRIEEIEFRDGMALGRGTLLDSYDTGMVAEQVEAGVVGPSVDLDDIEYVMDGDGTTVLTRWRIAGATLVAIPAFAGVSFDLGPVVDEYPQDPSVPGAVTAAVRSSGWSDMPIADEGRAWDGSAAAGRVFSWAGGPDDVDWGRYARAFLQKKDGMDPETKGAYGYGIADVIDGALTIIPRGVFAAAAAVQGSRGATPGPDAEGMRRVLGGIYRRMDRTPPWETESASLRASAEPAPLPPASWFTAPDLDRLTPLTVSDTGRVFGHIAGWDTCHVGLPGCVTPPHSLSGYSAFHVSAQRTREGDLLPVGVLSVGGGHADTNLGFRAAGEHYDDVAASVARVVAGEDEFGIWVAGWMLPEADPVRCEQFMSCPVSGDWRDVGGSLELIAVCSVNTPGFPVPRARVAFAMQRQRALIASSGMKPVRGAKVVLRDDGGTARAAWVWAEATSGRS